MKTIAFLYNVRHHYPDPKDLRNQLEADFDDPITNKHQIKHLRNCGYRVIPIEANEKAYYKLYRLKDEIDLVFNIAEGLHGLDRESHLPAILEMLQIPYTGGGPLTEGLILNKVRTKEILLLNHIPTPPYQLLKTESESVGIKLDFPLIVKPLAQGSSAGITNKSVVYHKKELRNQTKKIISIFKQPALVEPFLTGREFSIAMLGNPPMVLPIIESDHSILPKKYLPLDSLEVKWYFEEKTEGCDYLTCPAELNGKLKSKLKEMSLHIWEALDIQDWCRIDIRCDEKENPYVLEVNSPPGILPPEISSTSYFPLACRKIGIDYKEMLKSVVAAAWKRYHHK
ncbi:D-alanine--D-alanine ligase [Candidatus Roizmanbacteria bacterium CG02_land_8_20_14_3_00_36_15]|nr:MAG: D-alanine--D-alanine ligase [Candidatus Roizmanbacteria bacterium CG02_land_8_20_14_3_00_36_15]